MSASISHLTELPNEVLEQILLHLPYQDIIKMEVVGRQFRDLTRDSPTLQYKRDIFSACLVENPCSPCDLTQRRKACEEHEHKWSKAARVVEETYELPEGLSLHGNFTTIHGRNLISSRSMMEDGSLSGLSFVCLPPVTSQQPIKWWSIHPFRFNLEAFAVYLPDNIIAIAEQKERFVRIHFFNLSDGSPRPAPPSNITWELPQEVNEVSVGDLAITGSRIMMRVHCGAVAGEGSAALWRAFVWDWKTGDLVLDLSSTDDNTPVTGNSKITFLDEYRMMVLTPKSVPGVPEFSLFDTLVPRGHPVSSRRFHTPPRCHDWLPTVFVDGDRFSGILDPDRPLTTDPAQAVFVLRLIGRLGLCILLIGRIQTLIEHVRSVSTDGCVPWDKWGRDVVVMDMGVPRHVRPSGVPYPSVHGARVIVIKRSTTSDGYGHRNHLHTFDFSRRGWNALRLYREGDGVARMAAFEDGHDLLLQGSEEMKEWGFRSLGDGRLIYLDNSSGSSPLHVWELI